MKLIGVVGVLICKACGARAYERVPNETPYRDDAKPIEELRAAGWLCVGRTPGGLESAHLCPVCRTSATMEP